MTEQILVHSITPDHLRAMMLEVVQEVINQTTSSTSRSDIPELSTRKQTKDITGLSYPTLSKFDADGTLPAVRIGRKVLYKRQDILNALKSTKRLLVNK